MDTCYCPCQRIKRQCRNVISIFKNKKLALFLLVFGVYTVLLLSTDKRFLKSLKMYIRHTFFKPGLNLTFQRELRQVFTPHNVSLEYDPRILIDLQDFHFILNNASKCTTESKSQGEGIYFMTLIHSSMKNKVERQTIRRTWGSISNFINLEMRLVFLLGSGSPASDMEVRKESKEYGDIITGNFQDTYRNLSYKHIMGYKWVSEFCPNTKWVLKADDDIFVDIFQMFKAIFYKLPSDPAYPILCPLRVKHNATRGSAKWATTVQEYPFSKLPPFCIGTAYLIRPAYLQRVLLASQNATYFWVDDLFVMGVLREIVRTVDEEGPASIDNKFLYIEGGDADVRHINRTWTSLPLVVVGMLHGPNITQQMEFLWEKAIATKNDLV